MSKVQRKCLVEGCNDFGQYKGYQGMSATKYYSNYCKKHDKVFDRPAPVEAEKELATLLGDYMFELDEATHIAPIRDKYITALLAWRDKQIGAELDFIIRTDEYGDYIHFFDGERDKIRGNKAIIHYLYNRLNQLGAKDV